jgi:hypothetical protein
MAKAGGNTGLFSFARRAISPRKVKPLRIK